MKWDYTCNRFKRVRELINEKKETPRQCMLIMTELESCCDEITPDNRSEWIYYDEFRDFKSMIHEEIELMDEDDYESCEITVNDFLEDFYDLCDEARVWLGL